MRGDKRYHKSYDVKSLNTREVVSETTAFNMGTLLLTSARPDRRDGCGMDDSVTKIRVDTLLQAMIDTPWQSVSA